MGNSLRCCSSDEMLAQHQQVTFVNNTRTTIQLMERNREVYGDTLCTLESNASSVRLVNPKNKLHYTMAIVAQRSDGLVTTTNLSVSPRDMDAFSKITVSMEDGAYFLQGVRRVPSPSAVKPVFAS